MICAASREAPGCLALLLCPLLFPPKLLTALPLPRWELGCSIAQATVLGVGDHVVLSVRTLLGTRDRNQSQSVAETAGMGGTCRLPAEVLQRAWVRASPAGPPEAALCAMALLSRASFSGGFTWGRQDSPVMCSHWTLLELGAVSLTGPFEPAVGLGSLHGNRVDEDGARSLQTDA